MGAFTQLGYVNVNVEADFFGNVPLRLGGTADRRFDRESDRPSATLAVGTWHASRQLLPTRLGGFCGETFRLPVIPRFKILASRLDFLNGMPIIRGQFMNEKNVPLESLVGSHCLSGVDRLSEPNDDRYEPIRQVFRFTLDGITYVATEDPDDGYRSSLRTFAVSAEPTKNAFPPVAVTGRMKSDTQYESNHTLQLVDDVTGEVVLEVGTDNVGDYYPGFVAEWRPELLAPNARK